MTYSNTNAKSIVIKVLVGAALLASMPTLMGCNKGQPQQADKDLTGIPGEQFTSPDEPRQVHRMFDAAAASGARADATLHACHFDAGNPTALNSLGENKLDLMMSDDDALPMAVYLNIAGDEKLAGCEQSVRVYLRDRGLTDQQVKIVAGRNPGSYSPTAPKIKDAQAAAAKPVVLNGGMAGGGAAK